MLRTEFNQKVLPLSTMPRVLVVDDEVFSRKTIAALLHAQEYHIEFASTGSEALIYAEKFSPDVILLDVILPDMDGYAVCNLLKQNKHLKHIPIIMLTALDNRRSLERGLDAGADEFLSKPLNGAVLRARTRSMLRIKQQYDDLKDSLTLRESLAQIIAQDMKTPLAGLMLQCELLLNSEQLDVYGQEKVQTVRKMTDRLNKSTNDLLLMTTTMNMEKTSLVFMSTNIGEVLESAVSSLQEFAETHNVTLNMTLPDETYRLAIDGDMFRHAIETILHTSIKSAPEHSEVLINLSYKKAEHSLPDYPVYHVCIELIDKGITVPISLQQSIFNVNELVALRDQNLPHLGVDMIFAKNIVDKHGGTLDLSTNYPQGSIYTILL